MKKKFRKTTMQTAIGFLPHFVIDANMDGVNWFKNSKKAERIPILFYVNSVSKSSRVGAAKRLLKQQPFIVGLFHGTVHRSQTLKNSCV